MDKPIAIYNSDKKELIGLFAELMLVAKYLRPTDVSKMYSNLSDALYRKGAVRKTIFSFRIAIRFANDNQINLLGDKKVFIMNNYPEFDSNKLEGYHSTRSELYKKHTRR